MSKKILVWWSAGATSAVAAKLALDKFGVDNCVVVYFKISSAHKDNKRFKKECQKWYGCKILTYRSDKYKDQFDVITNTRYVNGAYGARCTSELKRLVRLKVESDIDFSYQIFGFENTPKEIDRASRIPEYCNAIFPLIEGELTKSNCLGILESVNIKLPKMYRLGYPNNNCIGCVKGGMGYWNKIRVDFPAHFNRMAKAERDVGRTCLREKNGELIYLDTLDPDRGRELKVIIPECGFFCGDTESYI